MKLLILSELKGDAGEENTDDSTFFKDSALFDTGGEDCFVSEDFFECVDAKTLCVISSW